MMHVYGIIRIDLSYFSILHNQAAIKKFNCHKENSVFNAII